MSARLPLLCLLLAGCASSNALVSLGTPATAPTARDYVDQVKRWTRHGDMRSDFDATLIVDATLYSPEFQAAYVAKYLDVYKVTAGAADKVKGELAIPSEEGYVFHLDNQAHTYEVMELKKDRQTFWSGQ